MDITQTGEPTRRKPLWLWPGVVIVALQWLARFGVPIFVPDAVAFGVIGGLLGWLGIVVWWAFFSRAPRSERWGAVVVMIVALVLTSRFLDESIATSMMGLMFAIYATPLLSLAFVIWAAASRHLSDRLRRATMVAAILLACGVWTLLRTGGFTSEGRHDFAWRWAETPEERLMAHAGNEPTALRSSPAVMETGADWPGFRGPNRDGAIPGVRIVTDWSASPLVELWRRPAGPGWSSFAVRGDLLYTQEQRGDDEVVACYKVTTGEPVWRHRDPARFWEANAGAGPRGTPTLSNGRVYTFGATGILNVLDAADGTAAWSRNAASDTGAKVPMWGFASSPVVVDDLVIVAVEGTLAAYDLASGKPRWFGPAGGDGYSSPHRVTIDGVEQILLMSKLGAASVAPADGKRKWKGGRYGSGQLILLPDQDLLLVLSEQGGLALVEAVPGQFTELARFPAIEGKTWNHPVLAGDILLVRNAEEMAAFRLSLAGSRSESSASMANAPVRRESTGQPSQVF